MTDATATGPTTDPTSGLTVRGLHAGHHRVPVLHGVDLCVPRGTLVALLGPSGCGKTTLLRSVAGLHRPTAGTVDLAGTSLDAKGRHVPTHRRGITLVPQEAGLMPHLDVAANVRFGLRGHADADRRTEHVLRLVGLDGLGDRRPHELSGGQQQRVALARALAPRPSLVLLDEPFSSLDARLRDDLRTEVRALLAAEDATALLVTHDQEEALSMADEVAVMREGRVLQQDVPQAVYRSPRHAWTARFLGEATVLAGEVVADGFRSTLGTHAVTGGSGTGLVVRADDVVPDPSGTTTRVVRRAYVGHGWLVDLDADGQPLVLRTAEEPPPVGSTLTVSVRSGRLVQED